MGFFAKKKTVEYETERSLPTYTISPDGFVIFDDSDLGGAAIMEVIPKVMTEGMTHEDPLHNNISTDDPNYIPQVGGEFADMRKLVYPGWVHFVNSLHAIDPADDSIHIQILAKKCLADEWITRVDYAYYKTEKELHDLLFPRRKKGSEEKTPAQKRKDAVMRERARDYLDLLDFIKYDMDEVRRSGIFDVRSLPAYTTKFFLVISYTPTSEGWWMDGRDSDYYIADNISATNIFSADNIVESVADMITRRRNKKAGPKDAGNDEELFWIAGDRTVQVLDTRIKKIRRAIKEWNAANKNMPMPFRLRALKAQESAALICFFPNILTPYWDKIWDLKTNELDVLHDIDRSIALATGDISKLNRNADDIVRGNVNIRHTDAEREQMLSQYRGISKDQLRSIGQDYDDRTWSVEKEEERARKMEERRAQLESADELWAGLDDTAIIADEFKTDAERREDYVARFKNKTPSLEYRQFNQSIREDKQRKAEEARQQEEQRKQRQLRKQQKQQQQQQQRQSSQRQPSAQPRQQPQQVVSQQQPQRPSQQQQLVPQGQPAQQRQQPQQDQEWLDDFPPQP